MGDGFPGQCIRVPLFCAPPRPRKEIKLKKVMCGYGNGNREIWNALSRVSSLPRRVELLCALDLNLRFLGMDVWIIFLKVSLRVRMRSLGPIFLFRVVG